MFDISNVSELKSSYWSSKLYEPGSYFPNNEPSYKYGIGPSLSSTGFYGTWINIYYFHKIMCGLGLENKSLKLSVPTHIQYLPTSYYNGLQQIKMLVLHDTGNEKGDSAKSNYNYFTGKGAIEKSLTAHAFIDNKELLLTIPINQGANHVKGSYQGKSFNENSYGLELCNLVTQKDVDEQFSNAAKYFAQLCLEFNLDPYIDIHSHKELSILGNVSVGHVDPDAYLAKWGYNMDKFRNLVADYLLIPIV